MATAVSNMADAVTHARFVGTDPASDEVVLMKILQVISLSKWSKVAGVVNQRCSSVCGHSGFTLRNHDYWFIDYCRRQELL